MLIFGFFAFLFENILGIVEFENKKTAFLILFMVQVSVVFCNVVGEAILVENSGLKLIQKFDHISEEQLYYDEL